MGLWTKIKTLFTRPVKTAADRLREDLLRRERGRCRARLEHAIQANRLSQRNALAVHNFYRGLAPRLGSFGALQPAIEFAAELAKTQGSRG